MREILFRGKRVDNGKWVEGDFCHPSNICKESIGYDEQLKQSGVPIWEDYNVQPETVGQYTGLTDKNGKKIFEGDIVKTTLGITRIVFDKCRGFGGYSDQKRKTGGLIYLQGIDLAFGEIIGNIHDNPELLK